VGHFLPSAIFGALAKAIPERVLAGSADPIWISVWRSTWPDSGKASNFTLFQIGGMGARPSKDGLNATGFPSGVAGVPAEVIETQAPLIQHHRQLRIDSGGAGKFRGGLGQATSITHRGKGQWSLSGMVDRTTYPAHGLKGGLSGALGEFEANGERLPPKTVMWFEPDVRITLNPPGGGGYGNPLEREPQDVLKDVINGYVSIEAAKQSYGVVVHFLGKADSLVRLPEHYALDLEATKLLRQTEK
jgi:N-methylhydantoinase B